MASFVSESSPLFMPMTFMMEWQLRANCCEAGFCDLFYAIRPNLVNVDTQAGSEALRIAELTRIRQTSKCFTNHSWYYRSSPDNI